jgi:hypothetical protein
MVISNSYVSLPEGKFMVSFFLSGKLMTTYWNWMELGDPPLDEERKTFCF